MGHHNANAVARELAALGESLAVPVPSTGPPPAQRERRARRVNRRARQRLDVRISRPADKPVLLLISAGMG